MTTAYAGPDINSCGMETVEITGSTGTYYNSVEWTASGSGTFSDATAMHPDYTPSEQDYQNGQVELTLTVNGEEGDDLTDQMIIYFHDEAEVSVPESFSVCEGDSLMIDGVEASSYSAVEWSTHGTGSFSDASLLNPVYHPGEEDMNSGSVIIQMQALGMGSCPDVTMEADVMINELPSAVITTTGEEICEGEQVEISAQLTGAAPWDLTMNGEEYTGIQESNWSHSFTVESSEEYAVESVTDANGCSNTGEGVQNVTMNPLPEQPAAPVGNQNIDLVYDSTTPYTISESSHASGYEWSLVPENAGTLESDGTTTTVTWNNDWTGDAEIQALAVNDCGISENSEALKISVENTIGIAEGISASQIEIYPNPSNGVCYISVDAKIKEPVTVKVTDALSNVVLKKENLTLDNTRTRLELGACRKGVYLLILENTNGRTVKRLVIQ